MTPLKSSSEFAKDLSLNLRQTMPFVRNQDLNEAISAAQSLSNGANSINWHILEKEKDKAEDTASIQDRTLNKNVEVQNERTKFQLFTLQIKSKLIWIWDKSKDVKEDSDNAIFWYLVIKWFLDKLTN